MEEKSAQLQVKKGFIVMGMSSGTVFWETPSRARQLLDGGAVILVGGNMPGPTESKPAGPSKTKAPSTAATAGPSSVSPESPVTGTAKPSASSEEVQVSPKTKSPTSRKAPKLAKRKS